MSLPTFKEYLSESLSDLAKGKGEPARANYPKTNLKRFMDSWNEKLGTWVRTGERRGYDVKQRVNANADSPIVIDVIDHEKDALVSTAVISGHDDLKSGQYTFDFYNMRDVHTQNKYRVIPSDTKYVEGWKYKEMSGESLHHSDQRNTFTSDKEGRTMANSRQKDGDQPSWATAIKGNRKPRS